MKSDIAFRSARKLAKMVGRKEVGCLELLDHYIDRVERHDGKINAVVVRDFERARARARAADNARDGKRGALHGVPMTVKESYNVAGLATTWGVEANRGNIARRNAVLVDRLFAAGANVFGKT
ncbi:MAG: amidase, partial [Acetobacteraceae bacterium]|nr:amidase [Acetobacteraceae bacterium]